jgi:hypothetical protein
MNYAPLPALRVVGVETAILLAFFLAAYLSIRLWRPLIASPPAWLAWILARNHRAVLVVIITALLGRAYLLPILGIPLPRINDEYSYLVMADTFAHHRLANPTPRAWPHFEMMHENMLPTFHSKFPVSQGLALAFGQILFHLPWIGVYLSTALLCGAICWSLQAFVPPAWAFFAGMFAVFRLALLSYWMNSYYGGSLAALGGAIALGALARLFEPSATPRRRIALAVAFALAILLIATSRPYEGLAFSLPLLAYFCYRIAASPGPAKGQRAVVFGAVAGIGLAGLFAQGYYDRQTTGDPLLLPYALHERVYATMPLFIWQRPKPAITPHDPVFAKYYEILDIGYREMQTPAGYLKIEAPRFLLHWFFYAGVALTFPALIGLLLCLKTPRVRLAFFALLFIMLALLLSVHSMPHYFSTATVVVYLFADAGLDYMWNRRRDGERAFVIAVCLTAILAPLARQTGSTALFAQFAFRDTHREVAQRLDSEPGKHLILVTYDLERHSPFNEIVHNTADFDSQKIIWARAKGGANDADLCQAYPGRRFWSLYTDDLDFSLNPSALCMQDTR